MSVVYSNHNLDSEDSVKFLRLWVDGQLNWNWHIEYLLKHLLLIVHYALCRIATTLGCYFLGYLCGRVEDLLAPKDLAILYWKGQILVRKCLEIKFNSFYITIYNRMWYCGILNYGEGVVWSMLSSP